MNYLLLFTIGPVQPLITNSRKARDMYAGSKFLSSLMRDTVRKLKKEPDVKILFPVEEESRQKEAVDSGRAVMGEPDSDGPEKRLPADGAEVKESDMPNRLIAEFLGNPDKEEQTARCLENRIREMEQWLRGNFLDKCRTLLKEAGIADKGLRLAEKQLEGYLEIYWMFEPYDGKDYSAAYGSLFRNIHVVKSIRPFPQAQEPWSRKCMLFPEYNAIFAKKTERNGDGKKPEYPPNVNEAAVYDITEPERLRYAVKPKEALSALALVKRVYGGELEMYSLRQMLLRSRVDSSWLPETGPGRGDMLANAVYDRLHGNGPEYEEYDETLWEASEALYGRIQEQGIPLSSYYALVKFDGDSMGEEFLKRRTPEKQQELSRNISRFAKEIPKRIGRHKGLAVYAGGEDFLGFLPVDSLFACLDELRRSFQDIVKLSFSAGVVVAHLMQPLKEVAAAAEEMEALAKQAEGKNACVIGVQKRSGETVITPPYRFGYGSGEGPVLKEFGRLVMDLKTSRCSGSLLYHIGNLFRPFQEEGSCPDADIAKILIRDAAARSGVVLRSEGSLRSEGVLRSEGALRSEEVLRSEGALRSEGVLRPEGSLRSEGVLRPEGSLRSEEVLCSEESSYSDAVLRSDLTLRPDTVLRPEKAEWGDTVDAVGTVDAEQLAEDLMVFYRNDNGLKGFLDTLNAAAFLAREVMPCSI